MPNGCGQDSPVPRWRSEARLNHELEGQRLSSTGTLRPTYPAQGCSSRATVPARLKVSFCQKLSFAAGVGNGKEVTQAAGRFQREPIRAVLSAHLR